MTDSGAHARRHVEDVEGVEVFRWSPDRPDGAQNFGDDLGLEVVASLVRGAGVARVPDPVFTGRLLGVGSVLHFAEENDVVWGSGINGKVFRQKYPVTLDVRAVRGPYTRAILLAHGIRTPQVYGDPGLLIGEALPALREVAPRGPVFVPNLNDIPDFPPASIPTGMEVISPLGDTREVLAAIAGSSFVVATSLHALIVADALGIPSRPLRPLGEHPLKFLDYYAGTGRTRVEFAENVADALSKGAVDEAEVDLNTLRSAFPIDLWQQRVPYPFGSESPSTLDGMRDRSASVRDRIVLAADPLSPEAAVAQMAMDLLIARNPPSTGVTAAEAARIRGVGPGPRPRRVAGAASSVLLSVIVRTHDDAATVGETLRSIVASGPADMEIIVVDDHSTDETAEIVEGLAAADDRIRLIRAVSVGRGNAGNLGVEAAKGRYLEFCEGDVPAVPGALAALLDSLEASGSDIAIGDRADGLSDAGTGMRLTDAPSLLQERAYGNTVFRRSLWDRSDASFAEVSREDDVVPTTAMYLRANGIDVVGEAVSPRRERIDATPGSSGTDAVTAFREYVRQETRAAELIARSHSREIATVYSSVVWDRDGWARLEGFLRAGRGDQESVSIGEEIDGLLAAVGAAPRTLSPAKALTWELARRGLLPVARAMSAAAPTPDVSLDDWLRVLREVREGRLALTVDSPVIDRMVTSARFAATDPEQPADTWIDLVAGLDALFGRAGTRALPELLDGDSVADKTSLRRVLELTRLNAGRVTSLRGGRSLTVTGDSALDPSDAQPVIIDSMTGKTFSPRHVVDVTVLPDGRYSWTATFGVRAFPVGHELVIGQWSRSRGGRLSVRDEAARPPYDRFDWFVFDAGADGRALVRRAHWAIRAAGRALRTAGVRSNGEPSS